VSDLRLILRLAASTRWLFLANGAFVILNAYLLPLVPPLAVRALLDALTGSAGAARAPETLLALLAAFILGYALVHLTSHVLEPVLQSVAGALLRHNLLARVLERPGARALPASPGEAVARFRNDVDEVGLFLCLWLDPLGQLLAFAFALAVLLRVDALLTVLVLLPPLGVIALVGHAGRRLRAYRRATQ
jgi:ATP-binding cassette, subfamily B, bacterial